MQLSRKGSCTCFGAGADWIYPAWPGGRRSNVDLVESQLIQTKAKIEAPYRMCF